MKEYLLQFFFLDKALVSNLDHPLVLILGELYHLLLAFHINFEVFHAVAEGGGGGSLSPRLLSQLVERRIEDNAEVLLVVDGAILSGGHLRPVFLQAFRFSLDIAVPKVYLSVGDEAERFPSGSGGLFGHTGNKIIID